MDSPPKALRDLAFGQLRRPVVQDLGPALLLLIGTFAWHDTLVGPTPWWLATVACLAAVAVRRRWPMPALVAAAVGTLVHMVLMADPTLADLAAPVVLYTVASRYRRKVSAVVLAIMLSAAAGWSLFVALDGRVDGWVVDQVLPPEGVVIVETGQPVDRLRPTIEGHLTRTGGGPTDWGSLPLFGALIAGWAIGSSARNRRAYLDELTARARDLERERDQQAALAAAAERSRLTRELHDVVAHGLAVIVMQAQGGAAAFQNRPADTQAALDAIVQTGRASLADMRQVLAAVGPIDGSPPPGMDRLPQLLDQVRTAGTPVQFHVEGAPRVVPAPVDLTSYRIIQEALTNTMKHAGPGACTQVTLRYRQDCLLLEVADDGTTPPTPDDTGNGIRGMRERVALLGGELSAAPGPHGGFVVRARLPIEPEART